MRLAVTLGISADGKSAMVLGEKGWVSLGKLPAFIAQRATVNAMTLSGGRAKEGDKDPLLSRAYVLTTSRSIKRRKFDRDMPERVKRIAESQAKLLAERKKIAPQDFVKPSKAVTGDRFDSMTAVELLTLCKAEGIEIPATLRNKPEVILLRPLVRNAMADRDTKKARKWRVNPDLRPSGRTRPGAEKGICDQ